MKVDANSQLDGLLAPGIAAGASDWQFGAGLPVSVRIEGRMAVADPTEILAQESVLAFAASATGRATAPDPGYDASFFCAGHLFRFHAFTAFGGRYCFSLRRLAGEPPDLTELGVPSAFAQTALKARRGLILVSGPTGSGKSTTLAAAIRRLNAERSSVIFTLEDPIEFRHPPIQSVVRQLEKGVDFTTFAEALHGALRADPDILLVGEMRDRETMSAALAAAETGHLVLATLHAASAAEAVSRITGAFDASDAAEIRAQFAQQLVAVLAQQLVHGVCGKSIAAFELLLATPGVRRLIADPGRRCALLDNEISLGGSQGMVSMDQSLEALVRRGAISRAEGTGSAFQPREFGRRL
ncbi:MAG TPA: ATPase, T2SS/T4P/T4SS family [Opitutaceae bacterium]|jgi:twitching motility protein PilT